MSAAEVIEQMQKLPPEERQKVAAVVRDLEADARADAPRPVSEEFKRVTDKVFTTNAELFRKLAQ